MNHTFLTLAPKVEHPQSITQFRPIGLYNVTYKIVTKAIVERLKEILPHVIVPTQASFVSKHQITDNVIIIQNILHTMRQKQGTKGYMAMKIDFKKAYDRLRWSFIKDTIHKMKLPCPLVEVIHMCLTTWLMSVLWNGVPLSLFKPTRGIRQGDPLSPYLFVICMERLAHVIDKAVTQKKVEACFSKPRGSSNFKLDVHQRLGVIHRSHDRTSLNC